MKKSLFLLPLLACVMSLTSCPGPEEGSDSNSTGPESTIPFEEGPWNDDLTEGETALEDVINAEDGTMLKVRGTVIGHSGSSFGLYRNGHWLYVFNIQPSSAPEEGETDNRIWKEGELPTGAYVEITALKSSYNGSAQLSGYNDGKYVDGRTFTVIEEEGQTVSPVVFTDSSTYDMTTHNGALVSIDGFATAADLAYVAGDQTTITWGDPVDPSKRFEVRMESYHSDETAEALVNSFPTFEKYHYYTFVGMAVKTSQAWRMLLVDSSTITASSKAAYIPPAAEEVITPEGFYDTEASALSVAYGSYHDLKVEVGPALAEQDLEVTVPADAKFTVEDRGGNTFRITPTENVDAAAVAVKFAAKSNTEISTDVYVKVTAITMMDIPEGTYNVVVDYADVPGLPEDGTSTTYNIVIKESENGNNFPTMTFEVGPGCFNQDKYREFAVAAGSYLKATFPENVKVYKLTLSLYKYNNLTVHNGVDNSAAVVSPTSDGVDNDNPRTAIYDFDGSSNTIYLANNSKFDNSIYSLTFEVAVGEYTPTDNSAGTVMFDNSFNSDFEVLTADQAKKTLENGITVQLDKGTNTNGIAIQDNKLQYIPLRVYKGMTLTITAKEGTEFASIISVTPDPNKTFDATTVSGVDAEGNALTVETDSLALAGSTTSIVLTALDQFRISSIVFEVVNIA